MFVTGPNVENRDARGGDKRRVGRGQNPREQVRGYPFHGSQRSPCDPAHQRRLEFSSTKLRGGPEALDYTPGDEQRPALDAVVPESAQQPYDIREVVKGL